MINGVIVNHPDVFTDFRGDYWTNWRNNYRRLDMGDYTQRLKWLKETHDIEELYVKEINSLGVLETKEYLQFNRLAYEI